MTFVDGDVIVEVDDGRTLMPSNAPSMRLSSNRSAFRKSFSTPSSRTLLSQELRTTGFVAASLTRIASHGLLMRTPSTTPFAALANRTDALLQLSLTP